MAHNIARDAAGNEMMAYVGETPWHRLGVRCESLTDPAEAMRAARLDWTVRLEDLFLKDGRLVAGRRAVIREDGAAGVPLGTVGSKWTPVQNADAFAILGDACRDLGVTIESAGALGDGATVWMLARMPEASEPIPGDRINNYFLISQAHDGTRAYGARPTRIRVVCQNTLAMSDAAAGADLVRIAHTASANRRLDEARRLVSRIAELTRRGDELARDLYARKMTPAEVTDFIHAALEIRRPDLVQADSAVDERRRTIASLVWTGKGADVAGSTRKRTTAWAAYNAVVEYFDHVRPAEAASDAGRLAACESALFGGNARLKSIALRAARQLVAA